MSTLEQLIAYYFEEEKLTPNKGNIRDSIEYYEKMLKDHNVTMLTDNNNNIIALMEVWVLSEEQFKRIVEDKGFYPRDENLTDGEIYFVNDLYIKPDHRHNGGMVMIRNMRRVMENIYGKKKVIVFSERKNNDRYRTFQGGG